MLALLYLVGCFFVFPTASTLDEKLVIAVRNGLEKNLHYIDKNYEKMNVDCILGVTIAAAVMQDAYEHGKHIMDKSSLNILNQTRDIVRKSKPLLKHNGVETWVINNVIDDSLWLKHISYKKKNLIPYSTNFTPKVLETIYLYENLQYLMLPSTDYCLHDVIKASKKQKRVNCFIKQSCWKTYFKSTFAVGYVLTHKLILLQVARNRGCLMPKQVYEIKIENLCSQILYEVLNEEHYGSMEDLFDLFLEQTVMQDAYEHGKHIMDKSSLNILNQTRDIVRKSKPLLKHNGVETWVINNVIDDSLWLKHISYKKKNLIPYSTNFTPKVLETIYLYENLQYLMLPSTDYCLHDVIKASKKQKRVNCFIKQSCWKTYFKSTFAVGYVLTHKLILLQVARNRGCLMPKQVYEIKIENLCSQILYEVLNEEHYGSMEDLFDLFLEQIVVCGYEGFRDFFKNRWLFLILKSQRESGCFPVRLEDNLKTRMKKNTNIFEDGCADHTTGLATAVLALYYNFIIKGNNTVAY